MRLALLMTTVAMAFAGSAHAQAPRLELHDPYFVGTELGTRALSLGGRGLDLEMNRGGRVDASLEFIVDCQGCSPREQQQLLVGFAGANEAQACIWQGGPSSNGWQAARFTLEVPNTTGIYEVRARTVRARSCADAMRQWGQRHGRDGSIGVIVVDGAGRPDRGEQRKRREIAELQRAFDATLERQERIQREQLSLSAMGGNTTRTRQLNALVRESVTLTTELRLIQSELREALEEMANPGRPRFTRPMVTVVADPDPFPVGMNPAEFEKFSLAVAKANFASEQLRTIKDYLATGLGLSTSQAIQIMRRFMHDSDKVEAAVLMCPRILEANPLLDMLGALTFDSDRQKLRQRTQGRCGI